MNVNNEYIFEVLDHGNLSKLLVLQQEELGPFINYDKNHTQMIVCLNGQKQWICIKTPYEKIKEEIDLEEFQKV